jgi:putative ABC transport system permease protein
VDELLRQVQELPGVFDAGVGSNVPFGHDDYFRPVRAANGAEFSPDLRAVSPNYFEILQMPLTRGRGFSVTDSATAQRVAIVNERLARKLGGGGDVLGQTVGIGRTFVEHQIVGVVADARSDGKTVEAWDEIYVPYVQNNPSVVYVIVHSRLDSGILDPMIRKAIRSAMPQAPEHPMLRAMRMEDMISRSLAGPRFSATLFSAFAANALLLAAIGVFGLVAYSVSQREPEFGIRAALGAHPRSLLVMVMRSTTVLTAIGLGAGVALAAYLTRFIKGQLYAIEPLDVPTFAAAVGVMLAVALLASWLPARRAARVDPLVALRYE